MHRRHTLQRCADISRIYRLQSCRHASSSSSATLDELEARPPPKRPPGPKKNALKGERSPQTPGTRKRGITREEFKIMSRFANKIVDATTVDPKKNWSFMPTLRGDEMRIRQAIKPSPVRSKFSTLEETKWRANENLFEEGEDASISLMFEPGTFVETRRNEQATHGVILFEQYVDRRWRVVVLTNNGDIWFPLREDVMFAVGGFIPKDQIERCGVDVVTTDESQLNARAAIIKRLRQIDKAVEDAYGLVETFPKNVYSQLRAHTPTDWNRVTLSEVANLVFSKNADLVNTFAVHKFMMSRPREFLADNNYRLTHAFHVRPKDEVETIISVMAMTRHENGALDQFVERARAVIKANTLAMDESRGELPTSAPGQHQWTTDDQQILHFLSLSLRPVRSIQRDPFALGKADIIKRIDSDLAPIDDNVVHKTLIRLGVLAPWQDLVCLRKEFNLDQTSEETSPLVAEQTAIVQKGFAMRSIQSGANDVLGPHDFHKTDPLEAVRHDFGDMAVYVIDDPTAQELDDGISVETIPGEPDALWVHVHVADPASFLPRTHVFAEAARKQLETQYFIHRSWPMLPRALMQRGLSIGTAGPDTPTRVLTFSGKVDASGDIVDYKIRAGLVRNLKITTYDSVDAALGYKLLTYRRPFEADLPAFTRTTQSIPADQVEDIKLLDSVSQRLVNKRLLMNTFHTTRSMSVIEKVGPIPHSEVNMEPMTYRGFPKLSYGVSTHAEYEVGSRKVVAEMAKLACRISSRFGTDHGLPMLRRAGSPIYTQVPEDMDELLAFRTPNGFIPFVEIVKRNAVIPPAEYSAQPKMHWALGVPEGEGYVRATSPLRRYLDLVHHWQIHHALLGPRVKSPNPPFSAAWLVEFSQSLILEDRARRRASDMHENYWKYMYLQRKLEELGPDHPMFSNLTGNVFSPLLNNISQNKLQCELNVQELGVQAVLGVEKGQTKVEMGDSVPIRIDSIRLGIRPAITVKYAKE
ncbi:hypothetical protein HGRIS_003307 [Hohenbuehelia grisea]|uniref:RNB domain-containing protein n=1 Tax=Hohenbuehelia grisea TaxID=104357 RepID=A0ABR3JG15_9AGAR